MKIIFNKNESGNNEVSELLGFINKDLPYKYLKTDIELCSYELRDFIGSAMYDKIADTYHTGEIPETFQPILKYAQLYILLKGYREFVTNGDLMHTSTGRKLQNGQDEKTAWDWQIRADNGALERRAYKALDRLILELDQSTHTEWKNSDHYKRAQSLFLYSTSVFQNVFPINYSEQLYYRLVPFMDDIETEVIQAILGNDLYTAIKASLRSPAAEHKRIINYCNKIIAYYVLAKAHKLLPEEMLLNNINYKLSDEQRDVLREKHAARYYKMAEGYRIDLEEEVAIASAEDYERNPLHGLDPESKHVNL